MKSQGVEEGSFVCDGAVSSISVVPTKPLPFYIFMLLFDLPLFSSSKVTRQLEKEISEHRKISH